jgi:hypothetical protein
MERMSADQLALIPSPDDGGISAALEQIAGLNERLTAVENIIFDDPHAAGYKPEPAPRWWQLTGDARAAAIARLADWTEQIYRPSYGQLAAKLPACWAQHALCLFVLDWLSELWSVLYLRGSRPASTVTGQAEFTTRYLIAAADLMADETRHCEHQLAAAQLTTVNGREAT